MSNTRRRASSRSAARRPVTATGATADIIKSWTAFLPALDATSFSIYFQLHQLDLLAIRLTNRIAAKFHINSLDVNLLLAVRREQGSHPVRPSDLWRRFDLAPSVITYRVDRLVKLRMLVRLPHPDDRRALHLRLTAKGEKTIVSVVRQHNIISSRNLAVVDEIAGGRTKLEQLLAALLRQWEQIETSK